MFERLDQTEAKYEELTKALASPEVINDSAKYQKTAKAHSEVSEIVEKYREHKDLKRGIQESRVIIAEESDAELANAISIPLMEKAGITHAPRCERGRHCRTRADSARLTTECRWLSPDCPTASPPAFHRPTSPCRRWRSDRDRPIRPGCSRRSHW